MRIPGFELLEKLGEGGMATVWKARQLSLDRIVAIKILSSCLSRDRTGTERFLKEAQAMAALKHPGIIRVYDVNIHEGMYYFVMEFVAGYSVGDWIRRKKKISEGDALLTADYVADALHYAWKTHRMIHCDIKPDNIMIDDDGTIKVADLGLSKSIGTPGARAESDDIMGTPNFMSPEQVMGNSDLDCRADVYSLGAMLYHMLTGKLLFQEFDGGKTMEQQVTGHVPDPLDLNPDLSMGTCWMIEKMLAKDRRNRQADWDAVLSDILRVLKGKMPAGAELPAGASTVWRSEKRNRLRGRRVERAGGDIRETRPLRTSTFAWIPVLTTAFVVTLIGGLFMWLEPWKNVDYIVKPPPEIPALPAEDPQIAGGAAEYRKVSAWVDSNPDDYDGAVQRLNKFAAEYGRTRFAAMALSRSEQLTEARRRDIRNTLAGLEGKTADLVKEHRFEEAAAIVRDYGGKFAGETADKRKQMVENILSQATEFKVAAELATQARERKSDELLEAASDKLVSDGVGAALGMMERIVKEQSLDNMPKVVDTVHLLRAVEALDERILNSFKSQEGQIVAVSTLDGKKTLKIQSVAGGKVRCEEYITKGTCSVRLFDLDLSRLDAGEMAGRLGQGNQDEVLFKKGILELQAKAFGRAHDFFGQTSFALSPLLTKKTAELSARKESSDAEQALLRLMKDSGVKVSGTYDKQGWQTILIRTKFAGEPRDIEARVDAYRKEWGNSDFGRNAEQLLTTLIAKAKADAARALKAAWDQIDGEAIRKMLLLHNKDLEKEEIVIGKSGRYPGYSLRIRSGQLASLGTLRTYGRTITELDVSSSKLKDLSAISGMNLRSLDISGTRVVTLPMLSDLPLERLVARNVPVKEIGVLSRTKLLKELDLSRTKINDLRSISCLHLESLALDDLGVKDRDLDLLKNMPLKHLSIRNGAISSVAPLQKLPLESLDLSGNDAIRDFSCLAGMPLRALSLDDTGISDLGILKSAGLRSLRVAGTKVHDLSPLAGMELTALDISRTRVRNLAPLKGMRLVDLRLSGTRVSDLSPLSGMALNRFYCAGIRPDSWSPIVGMPITDLVVSMGKEGERPWFVSTLKQLRVLNGSWLK